MSELAPNPNPLANPAVLYPTLYAPATMPVPKLLRKMEGDDPFVRRFVVCTEDAVSQQRLPEALDHLEEALKSYEPVEGYDVFVRLRNLGVAEQVLAMEGVEKVRGFVVPKADPKTYPEWASAIAERDERFRIMPLLEARGMADYDFRRDLLEVLSAHRHQIDCVRIGGNDLLNNLGMRRPETVTIYETAVGKLIDDIVIEFRGNGGFFVSAPAFEYFGAAHAELFKQEITRHVYNQLFGQVVIHPSQLPVLWEAYKVDANDFKDAQHVTSGTANAVIGDNGRLVNTSTHRNWAATIILRSQLFGVR